MADKSLIEWTDATWNPITGCTLVDEGCRHCYAAHLITSWPAIGNHPSRAGLARKNAAGESKFTGEVRFNEQWLDQPLRWKEPRRIFPVAHGDLFHPSVPYEWVDKVFAVMALTPHHTYQPLTKRPERAREYLMGFTCDGARRLNIARMAGDLFGDEAGAKASNSPWPLPNVWLGTSASDQDSANLRIPELLACPAAVRYVSFEPLLSEIRFDSPRLVGIRPDWQLEPGSYDVLGGSWWAAVGDPDFEDRTAEREMPKIDWVICGGESGPHARPMHPDWARSLRDQCVAAGVPFLFKQWGEWAPGDTFGMESDDPVTNPKGDVKDWMDRYVTTAEWGKRLRGHSFTGHGTDLVYCIGKKAAGRLLDGVEWSQFPEVAA